MLVLLALAAAGEISRLAAPVPLPGCQVAAGAEALLLSTDQAANATTIAAEAVRLGLPPQAATVAFAAALQESGLQDLPYGDRDSVGLFQQRPSQGWGPRASLLNPAFAATAFYARLVKLPDWQSLPVGQAAQLVQRSATPDAYAGWVSQAETLATTLTGQLPVGLTCRFPQPTHGLGPAGVERQAVAQLGGVGVAVRGRSVRGWAAAAWLVGHARAFGIGRVSYAGRVWTAQSGTWRATKSGPQLTFLTGS